MRACSTPALGLAGLLAVCCAAPPPEDPPLLLLGVDGLEWDVMLPLVREQRLPVLADLMQRGSYGRLETLVPTLSPAIWTSVATGKPPAQHGIHSFALHEPERGGLRLQTSRDRRTKALWNVLTDHDRTVHVVGWWMSYPVEPIRGVMVAQTNTESQLDVSGGRAVWKGTLLPGVEGQVHPPALQERIMRVAHGVETRLPELTESVFGRFPHPPSELGRRLWSNTLWAFRADATYVRVARLLAASPQRFDLLMLYLGGPDVVGHRFWRYMHPELYRHPPTPEEIENFSRVIHDYYVFVDRALGAILDSLGEDATVLVVSDHGMHAVNREQAFAPDDPPSNVNSGHHPDGPPGVLIAAGPRLRRTPRALPASGAELPLLGSVLDVAPTVLALEDLPVGRDMAGEVLTALLEPDFLARRSARSVDTHDDPAWLAARAPQALPAQVEAERIAQLRELGYLE